MRSLGPAVRLALYKLNASFFLFILGDLEAGLLVALFVNDFTLSSIQYAVVKFIVHGPRPRNL